MSSRTSTQEIKAILDTFGCIEFDMGNNKASSIDKLSMFEKPTALYSSKGLVPHQRGRGRQEISGCQVHDQVIRGDYITSRTIQKFQFLDKITLWVVCQVI